MPPLDEHRPDTPGRDAPANVSPGASPTPDARPPRRRGGGLLFLVAGAVFLAGAALFLYARSKGPPATEAAKRRVRLSNVGREAAMDDMRPPDPKTSPAKTVAPPGPNADLARQQKPFDGAAPLRFDQLLAEAVSVPEAFEAALDGRNVTLPRRETLTVSEAAREGILAAVPSRIAFAAPRIAEDVVVSAIPVAVIVADNLPEGACLRCSVVLQSDDGAALRAESRDIPLGAEGRVPGERISLAIAPQSATPGRKIAFSAAMVTPRGEPHAPKAPSPGVFAFWCDPRLEKAPPDKPADH